MQPRLVAARLIATIADDPAALDVSTEGGLWYRLLDQSLVPLCAGHGSQGPDVATPKLLKGNQATVRAAAGESHTLLLSASGRVSSCGLNTFGQLGKARYPQDPACKADCSL